LKGKDATIAHFLNSSAVVMPYTDKDRKHHSNLS